jgi:type II secretory pathway pseudopilin PulG
MIKDSNDERGWALLGLLLALMVIGILMLAAVPSVRMQVQREKEEEMIYRGQQMAEAIARWYNFGNLGPINLQSNAGFGPLTELKRLREIMRFNNREIKFARASAFIDPMTSDEWEPVRVRDPRIAGVLNAYSSYNNVIIPPSYQILAGPPTRTIFNPITPPPSQSNSNSSPPGNRNASSDPEEEEEEDEDDEEDPLGRFFEPGRDSNLPIVGVAPKLKGPSVRSLWGLKSYEEWVFIYIPDPNRRPPIRQSNSNVSR